MNLLEAVAATFAVVGQEISDLGLKAIVAELQDYPPGPVQESLRRCQKELRKITLADILERIPTGHPGVEEAWAKVSPLLADEDVSVVWTDEMAQAFGVARRLTDDRIAARQVFKEIYSKAIAQAREAKKGPFWRPSLGRDPHGRQAAIEEAVKLGRLSPEHARKLIPDYSPTSSTITLPKMKALA